MSKKSKRSNSKKRSKWKMGIKAGCLALGMATAWGGEAKAELYLEVSAASTRTLTDVFVYYVGNNSFGALASLGTQPAGDPVHFFRPIPDLPRDVVVSYYTVLGIYGDGTGVAHSFSDDSVLTSHAQWSDVFESFTPNPAYNHSETEVIDALHQASAGNTDALWKCVYYCVAQYPRFSALGEQAVLVNFTDPTPGGSVTINVTTVPEPAAWILLVGAAGALLFWRSDLLTKTK
jgi:hypothetical protein